MPVQGDTVPYCSVTPLQGALGAEPTVPGRRWGLSKVLSVSSRLGWSTKHTCEHRGAPAGHAKAGGAGKCPRTSSCAPALPFLRAKAMQPPQEHRPENRGERWTLLPGVLLCSLSPPAPRTAAREHPLPDGLGGAELGSSQPHSESSTAPAEMAGTVPGGAEPAQLGGTGHKMFQQGKEWEETRINLWWMLCHCQLQNGRSSAPPSTSSLAPTPPRAAGLPGCSSCWVPWSGVERHWEALGVKRSLAPLGCWSISCRRALAAPLFSSTERGAHVQMAAAALCPHGKPGVTPSHVCSRDLWRCAGGCRRGVKPPPSPSLQRFCSGGGSSVRGGAVQRWASCCWVTRRAAAPLPATSALLLPGRWVLLPSLRPPLPPVLQLCSVGLCSVPPRSASDSGFCSDTWAERRFPPPCAFFSHSRCFFAYPEGARSLRFSCRRQGSSLPAARPPHGAAPGRPRAPPLPGGTPGSSSGKAEWRSPAEEPGQGCGLLLHLALLFNFLFPNQTWPKQRDGQFSA